MHLKFIQFTNFRNFEKFTHNFAKSLTIVYGKIAAGKTNFLEGVQFLSFSKSFRARHESDLIFWPKEQNLQKDFAKVIGMVESNEGKLEIDISIQKTKECSGKIIKINGAKRAAADLIGKFVSVVFSPEDILLISGAPSLRRRFCDIILAQQNLHYYHYLVELKKILQNRNKLLFDIKNRRANISELDFWDEKLAHVGSFIILKRKEFFEFLNGKIGEIYSTIIGGSHFESRSLEIRYSPNIEFESAGEIEDNFQKELAINREREIFKSRTGIGPHHDNFVFYLNGRALACFGSRGEWRSAVLALKILELDYLEEKTGIRPILLLDDIFSELDFVRRNHLAEIVQKQQTIITMTELDFISREFVDKGEMVEITKQ